jgi:hypothetical protein
MTEEKDHQPKHRRCAFVEDDGTTHGIELTPENSYKSSAYCKPHHNVMVIRARQSGPGRESNIARVKRYQQRHPEVVQRLSQESRERKARGEAPKNPGRGRPPGQAVARPPRPPRPPRAPKPRTCGFKLPDGTRHGMLLTEENSYKNSRYCKEHHIEMVRRAQNRASAVAPRCYKPSSSKRYHSYGEAMSACGQWVTPKDAAFVELPLDDVDLCAGCRRRLYAKGV